MPQIDLTIGGTGTETLFASTVRVSKLFIQPDPSNQDEVSICLNEDEVLFKLQPGQIYEYDLQTRGSPFFQGNAIYVVGTVGDVVRGRYL